MEPLGLTNYKRVELPTLWKKLEYPTLVNLCPTSKEYLNICSNPDTWIYLLQRDFNIAWSSTIKNFSPRDYYELYYVFSLPINELNTVLNNMLTKLIKDSPTINQTHLVMEFGKRRIIIESINNYHLMAKDYYNSGKTILDEVLKLRLLPKHLEDWVMLKQTLYYISQQNLTFDSKLMSKLEAISDRFNRISKNIQNISSSSLLSSSNPKYQKRLSSLHMQHSKLSKQLNFISDQINTILDQSKRLIDIQIQTYKSSAAADTSKQPRSDLAEIQTQTKDSPPTRPDSYLDPINDIKYNTNYLLSRIKDFLPVFNSLPKALSIHTQTLLLVSERERDGKPALIEQYPPEIILPPTVAPNYWTIPSIKYLFQELLRSYISDSTLIRLDDIQVI